MENNLSGTEPQTKENQKKKKSRTCFKRAWRAVKGAFSRPGKTKVVPFDTDPSDLEEDPYVQTHLRVFERVDIQDLDDQADPQSTAPEEPTDSQPGSSNLEQTSFQDPDVLQQGASGLEPSSPQHQAESTSGPSVLEPSAPEKPADHRPEPQTKENQRKKKSHTCFKRAWRAVKGAFSRPRKTKVVPFDTDPSDLEEDPYVQTHLRVCERVDIQDLDDPADPQSTAPEEPTDSQPGSSNLEQTSFQDPDVLQQGASGLEPSSPQHQAESTSGPSVLEPIAPEKPADHRPEPQTKENQKKKKSHNFFKRAWRAVKGAFSRPRKTKVVPFETDPSELEEDPYVQTHLHVFERVDIQDLDDLADPQSTAPEEPTDSQPGSSNLEQTSFQDPDVLQQGASGLEPSSPQHQAESTSGPSVLEPTASEESSYSQSGSSTASKVLVYGRIFLPSCSEEFTALYEVEYFIGSGNHGEVYGGFRRSDGLKVAIKTISTQYDPVERVIIPGHSKPLPKEVAINLQLLESGKCAHIMEMLDWFEEKHQLIIVMELPEPCMSLSHFVHDHPTDETRARHFMRQAIIGAKYCLDHGVNHVSLRVDNIVVNTETLQIKLIDFGSSKIIRSSGETDMNYCDRAYADANTVSSLGSLLYYIMCCNERGTAGLSEACRDLMKFDRWDFEEVDMPTLDEFMDHEWFKQG